MTLPGAGGTCHTVTPRSDAVNQSCYAGLHESGLFDTHYEPGSIGADLALRGRIEAELAGLGEARQRCFGYAAYGAIVAGLKRDFAIAQRQPWTDIWHWPVERADEIINYLQGRHAETLGHADGRRRSA